MFSSVTAGGVPENWTRWMMYERRLRQGKARLPCQELPEAEGPLSILELVGRQKAPLTRCLRPRTDTMISTFIRNACGAVWNIVLLSTVDALDLLPSYEEVNNVL